MDQFLHIVSLGHTDKYLRRGKLLFTVHCKDRKALSDVFQALGARINFAGKSTLLSKQFTGISRTVSSIGPTKYYFELQSYFTLERAPGVILSSLCHRLCKCHLGPGEKKKNKKLKLIQGSLL